MKFIIHILKRYYSYNGKYEEYGFKLVPHIINTPKEVIDIINIINKKMSNPLD